MSFSAMRKAAAGGAAEHEEADDAGPPVDVAPKLALAAEGSAGTAPPRDPEAPTSFDEELESDLVDRDIASEAVAPPTRTETEAEMAAGSPSAGGDPGLSGAAPGTTPETEPAAAKETSPESAGSEASETPAPKTPAIDEEELRSFGLDDLTISAIKALSPATAMKVVAEIREKNSSAGKLKDHKDKLEEALAKRAKRPPEAAAGLFSGIASAFQRKSPEARKLDDTERKMSSLDAYLDKSSIRDRVNCLRRQEIVQDANALSADHRRLAAAMQAFNSSLLATPAGQAFENELSAITARRPDLKRADIVAAAKEGRLASMIGDDPLTPHVREAFGDADVRQAWDRISSIGDGIERRGASLMSRMESYEEHFPGETDTEKLHDAVTNAMSGLDKTLQQPLAEDPEAEHSLRQRMAALVKAIQEFVEKLLARFGFGVRP
jgi:hypothetical protein